jgi:hypothetical protein
MEQEIDMKPFQYIDKVQKGIDDVFAFLEDNNERARKKAGTIQYTTTDTNNFTDSACKILQAVKDCDNDNTKAVYYKQVLDFVLECYFNAINACEYPANRE